MKLTTCFCLLLLLAGIATGAEPARIAIISDSTVKAEADLLTAELSKRDEIALVERDEIAKVLREVELQTGMSAERNAAQVAKMLKADGLLFLSSAQVQNQSTLTVRLVATDPGVVVASFFDPAPISEPESWSQMRAKFLTPFFPKLRVRREGAIALSLLNIKSSFIGTRSLSLENSVNFLLRSRLIQEPRFFVLERNRLDAAADERFLHSEDSGSFWNGSWIIDGVIFEKDNTIEATILLHPPDGTGVKKIEVKARDLSVLVEQTVAEIKTKFAVISTATPWNPTAEAAEYFDEARWAMRWNMFDQAAASAEAAFALGYRSDELDRIRAKAYSYLSTQINLVNKPGWTIWQSPTTWLEVLKPHPTLTDLQRSRHSLEVFLELLARQSFPLDPNLPQVPKSRNPIGLAGLPPQMLRPRDELHLFALDLLYRATRILGSYYFGKAPISDAEALELKELRRVVRETYAAVTAIPGNSLHRRNKDRLMPTVRSTGLPFRSLSRSPFANIFLLKLAVGSLWEERLDDFFPIVTELLKGEFEQEPNFFMTEVSLLGPVNNSLNCNRWNIDWSRSGENDVAKTWLAFSRKLEQEEDLGCRVASRFLRLSLVLPPLIPYGQPTDKRITAAATDADAPEELRLMAEAFHSDGDRIINGELPIEFVSTWLNCISPATTQDFDPYQCALRRDLKKKLDTAMADLLAELLAHDTPVNGNLTYFAHLITTPAQKDLVATVTNAYAEKDKLSVERNNANRLARPVSLPPGAGKGRAVTTDAKALWTDNRPSTAPGLTGSGVHCALVFENALWAEIVYQDPSTKHERRSFTKWDLDTLKSEIAFDCEGSPGETFPDFAVIGSYLYIYEFDHLRQVGLNDKKEEIIPFPAMSVAGLWLAGEQLFITPPDGGVVRISPHTKTSETLASSRRRPALSKLDDIERYHVSRVFQDSQKRINVLLNSSQFHFYDEENHDWVPRKAGSLPPELNRLTALEILEGSPECKDPFHLNDLAGELLSDFNQTGALHRWKSVDTEAYYAESSEAALAAAKGEHHSSVRVFGSVARKGELYALTRTVEIHPSFCLLCVPPAPQSYTRVALRFNGGLGFQRSAFSAQLVPVRNGVVLYAIGDSTLWYVPLQ